MFKSYFLKLKIQQKLYVMEFLVTGFAMCLVFFLVVIYQYKTYKNEFIDDLNSQSLVIESNISAAIAFDDRKAAEEILKTLELNTSVDSAFIVLNDQSIFASYNPRSSDNARNIKKNDIQISRKIHFDNVHNASIVVNANLNKVHARIQVFTLIMFVAVFLAMVLARFLAKAINRQITDPINSLYFLVSNIKNKQNYSQRSNLAAGDEIGELSTGINSMLDIIEQRDAKLSEELEYRVNAEKKLDQLAYFDSQTQLPNRHSFGERLSDAVSEAKQKNITFYLLILDLDNFKVVNDTLGHDSGDFLLKKCGIRLRSVIGEENPIFRIGGDEFAVILKNMEDNSEVETLCERIIHKLSQTFVIQSNEVNIGVSIGVVKNTNEHDNETSLVKNADIAMYWAKADGKNTYKFYSKEIEAVKFNEQKLITHLQSALINQEFELYYQPIFAMSSMTVIGFEALLRWHQKELGMISPGVFIPLAESTGLINPIGDWVIEHSLKQLREWQSLYNQDLFMNINLSARQFHNKRLVESIKAAILSNMVEAKTVNLEVTESFLMQNIDATIKTLASLKKVGVRISIDDFGTGHSSMNYLKRLPVNTIKIDKSFVDGLPKDKVDCAIVSSIFALAKSLGLDVVAEGIETEAQLNYLRKNNCLKGQGYLFSRPLKASDIEEMLKNAQQPNVILQPKLL